jgi:hypothetical protein
MFTATLAWPWLLKNIQGVPKWQSIDRNWYANFLGILHVYKSGFLASYIVESRRDIPYGPLKFAIFCTLSLVKPEMVRDLKTSRTTQLSKYHWLHGHYKYRRLGGKKLIFIFDICMHFVDFINNLARYVYLYVYMFIILTQSFHTKQLKIIKKTVFI